MERQAPHDLSKVSLLMLVVLGFLLQFPIHLRASTSFPSVARSGTVITITNPSIMSQFDLSRSTFTISYPQDQSQQFRLRISFLQLMEVSSPNQTSPSQVLDLVSLASTSWDYTPFANASEVKFGPNMQGQLFSTMPLQRGGNIYPINVSLVLFASLRQNEITIVTSDFWVASEPVGGPTHINIGLRITGWPFRTLADSIVLRMFIDGSQGTVSHRGEFSATELFNTIAIVNDVTQRQDASINWLRRAVVDNGTRISADVTLNTFSSGDSLRVDLYYPSFTAATLTHNLLLETSNAFQAAGFVPLQLATPLAGAATLFLLTISITYLSRRRQFVLRRNR